MSFFEHQKSFTTYLVSFRSSFINKKNRYSLLRRFVFSTRRVTCFKQLTFFVFMRFLKNILIYLPEQRLNLHSYHKALT